MFLSLLFCVNAGFAEDFISEFEGPGVMSRYFLTDKEIQAIVTYIREVQNREAER
ncbi:hypothetical protein [Nitratifractor sp.]